MSELATSLSDRREEFETHFAVAVAVEERIFAGDDISIGGIKLSARYLLTMKSGLLVHLYNIVESTMTRASNLVGGAFGSVTPRQWTEKALREWLRENAVARIDGNEDTRLNTVHRFSALLVEGAPLGPQMLKKPSGTWTDKSIVEFARRLGVRFRLNRVLAAAIAERPEFGDQSPLEFLAERRNALAHGRRSFEEGANDLTLSQIRGLADAVFIYLEATAGAFQLYVDESHYLVTQ
ncbi:MAE_28990/MAE_18760 family HEPN-like nuclease [Devosia sp. A16]|uniref:MAE_28990/MAE_18760 family HEPN-like nuclease n=1 Tax=Devosia sp. A16 TaxID=1736675 RepID=UPI0006D8598A|nr:MAE_28990/MAE_18760 family HEPN-like nuclease [Devosia sp. A16]